MLPLLIIQSDHAFIRGGYLNRDFHFGSPDQSAYYTEGLSPISVWEALVLAERGRVVESLKRADVKQSGSGVRMADLTRTCPGVG